MKQFLFGFSMAVAVVIVAYMLQVFAFYIGPYFHYRRTVPKEERTVGGLIQATNARLGDAYHIFALLPLFGPMALLVACIDLFIFRPLAQFIKQLHI